MTRDRRIVEGATDDIDVCIGIARSLPEHFNDAALARIPGDIVAHRTLVVLEEEDVGGFSVHEVDGEMAEVLWIAIHPDRQRNGLGTMLIEAIAERSLQEGADRLVVRTLAGSVDYEPYKGTRRFYERLGFTHVETIDPYPEWGEGNPCAVYSMDIRPITFN